MSRLGTFLLGMVVGIVLYTAAAHFHVVRARDGFHLVAKQMPQLSETYVDVRQFTLADWVNHPQLAAALAKANKQYLIGDSAANSLEQGAGLLAPGQPAPAWPDH
jgi:hypothetical protein